MAAEISEGHRVDVRVFGYRTFWVALGLIEARAQHSPKEAEALTRWSRGLHPLVEVGVAEGASAAVLRASMDPNGALWLIDPFHLSRNPFFNTALMAARRTANRVRRGRVHFVVGWSLDVAAHWDRLVDFVFIDADHRYESVIADWRAWSRFVVPGGIVAFHDALRKPGHPDGPAQGVDELFRRVRASGWDVVDEVETLVVVKRCPK